MRTYFKLLMLFVIFASGVRHASPARKPSDLTNAKKVPFCTLALNPEKYDGDVVITEAVSHTFPHNAGLSDPLCYDQRTDDGRLLDAQPTSDKPIELETEYMNALREDGNARIIFIGIVESKKRAYGPMGLPFQIRIQKLIAVHRITPVEREALGIPEGMNILLKRSPVPPPDGK
jgi:hypothetical protein